MAGINNYMGGVTLSRSLATMGMATINVDNATGEYDPLIGGLEFDLNKQVTINAGYKSGGPDPEAIFKALVMDARFVGQASSRDETQIRLGTLYKNLSKIPVHTIIYENVTGQVLLETVASDYARIPSTHYDFSAASGVTFTKVSIDESSCAEALRRIAQACQVWIFEDKTGKLMAKAIPDNRAIDFILSDQDVNAVTHISSDIDYYNKVRVVGGYKTLDDYSDRIVYNKIRTIELVQEVQTLRFTCELNMNIQTADGVTVTLYWTSPSNPSVDVKVEELDRDYITVVITRKDETYFLGTVTVQIVVNGTPEPLYINLPDHSPVPGEDFITRVEGTAEDEEGKAKYGANMELVVDNPSVQTASHAVNVATFILKQVKWSRHIFEISMPYDPRFELGDSLNVLYKDVNWQAYLAGITVSWNPNNASLDSMLRCPMMNRMGV